jgi:hypothetical protein
MTVSPATLLRQAADVIDERGRQRDTAGGERSMKRAVEMFNVMSGGCVLTELDGWLFMCVLKMSRATAGRFHLDDFTDLAGYAALAAECGIRENAPAERAPDIGRSPSPHSVNVKVPRREFEPGLPASEDRL